MLHWGNTYRAVRNVNPSNRATGSVCSILYSRLLVGGVGRRGRRGTRRTVIFMLETVYLTSLWLPLNRLHGYKYGYFEVQSKDMDIASTNMWLSSVLGADITQRAWNICHDNKHTLAPDFLSFWSHCQTAENQHTSNNRLCQHGHAVTLTAIWFNVFTAHCACCVRCTPTCI